MPAPGIVVESRGSASPGRHWRVPLRKAGTGSLFSQLIEEAHRTWADAGPEGSGGLGFGRQPTARVQADEPSPPSRPGGLRISPVSVSKPILWMYGGQGSVHRGHVVVEPDRHPWISWRPSAVSPRSMRLRTSRQTARTRSCSALWQPGKPISSIQRFSWSKCSTVYDEVVHRGEQLGAGGSADGCRHRRTPRGLIHGPDRGEFFSPFHGGHFKTFQTEYARDSKRPGAPRPAPDQAASRRQWTKLLDQLEAARAALGGSARGVGGRPGVGQTVGSGASASSSSAKVPGADLEGHAVTVLAGHRSPRRCRRAGNVLGNAPETRLEGDHLVAHHRLWVASTLTLGRSGHPGRTGAAPGSGDRRRRTYEGSAPDRNTTGGWRGSGRAWWRFHS